MERHQLVISCLWRILGLWEYRGKCYTAKDVAKLIYSEYGLSGEAAVTWKQVQAAVRRRKPSGINPDHFFIHWTDGCCKPVQTRGTPAPLWVGKALVGNKGNGGNRVFVIGWSKDPAGIIVDAAVSTIDESEPVPKLRIALVDQEKMATELSSDGSSNTNSSRSNRSKERETGCTSNDSGEGSVRTPPPASSGSSASSSTSTSTAMGGARTRRVSPPTAENESGRKRQRKECGNDMEEEDVPLATFPANYICIGGKYFEVPNAALSSLSTFIESNNCNEFCLPIGDEEEDDESTINMSNGQPSAPKHTKLFVQPIGSGSNRRGFFLPTSHHAIRVSDYNDLLLLRRIRKALIRIFCGYGVRFVGSPFHRRLLAVGIAMAPQASAESIEAITCFARAGILAELIEEGLVLPKGFSLETVAYGSTSKATVANLIIDAATDVKLLQLERIKKGDCRKAHLTGDGGLRNDMEHFPKLSSTWSRVEDRVLKMFGDNYQSGKSSSSIAASIDQYTQPQRNAGLVYNGATMDQGGGGNGNKVMPLLIENGVVEGDGNFNPCSKHCWNKPLEVSVIEALGGGGLGRRSVTSCWYLMRCFSLEQFRRFWSEATHHGM